MACVMAGRWGLRWGGEGMNTPTSPKTTDSHLPELTSPDRQFQAIQDAIAELGYVPRRRNVFYQLVDDAPLVVSA